VEGRTDISRGQVVSCCVSPPPRSSPSPSSAGSSLTTNQGDFPLLPSPPSSSHRPIWFSDLPVVDSKYLNADSRNPSGVVSPWRDRFVVGGAGSPVPNLAPSQPDLGWRLVPETIFGLDWAVLGLEVVFGSFRALVGQYSGKKFCEFGCLLLGIIS
jgi:hypothetical protein